MADPVVADRCRETSTTTGTGALTLAGATTGCRSFNSAVGVGPSFYYVLLDANGTGWEAGVGVLSDSTHLTRTTVQKSSNSNAAISLSSGSHTVFSALTEGWFTNQPFDVTCFYPGIPTASAKMLRVPVARAVTFPANFSGSYFSASANATGTTVFDVQKNGSSIGSVSIAAGGTTATFTTTSGTSKSFAAGDVISIIAPATPDATLADVGFVFAGTR